MTTSDRPLLRLVRDELVQADLDDLVDLSHLTACWELVEIVRDRAAVVVVHEPGAPLSPENFEQLTLLLAGTGVVLTRIPPGGAP